MFGGCQGSPLALGLTPGSRREPRGPGEGSSQLSLSASCRLRLLNSFVSVHVLNLTAVRLSFAVSDALAAVDSPAAVSAAAATTAAAAAAANQEPVPAAAPAASAAPAACTPPLPAPGGAHAAPDGRPEGADDSSSRGPAAAQEHTHQPPLQRGSGDARASALAACPEPAETCRGTPEIPRPARIPSAHPWTCSQQF